MPNNPGVAWIHNNGYDDAISTTAIGHNAVQQRFPEREGERHEIFLVRFSFNFVICIHHYLSDRCCGQFFMPSFNGTVP